MIKHPIKCDVANEISVVWAYSHFLYKQSATSVSTLVNPFCSHQQAAPRVFPLLRAMQPPSPLRADHLNPLVLGR